VQSSNDAAIVAAVPVAAMPRWSINLLLMFAVCGVVLALATRPIERALTFYPTRPDPAKPWPLPAATQQLGFEASDGVRLHGWLLRSQQTPSRGALLYLHGNAGNLFDFLPVAQHLRDGGFDVLLWDYRGYGRSEGKVEDETALYRDGEAALTTLSEMLAVPRQRIVLYGYSLGSAVATELAHRHGCRALILEAPFATARMQALSTVPVLPLLMAPFVANRFDTVGKIGDVGCPVLVIHGAADEVISPAQGRAVHAAAREPKRLVLVPGGRHWLAQQTGWRHVDEATRFIEQVASP
jgi:alpha-beta hydrolase superfamily lysophospholipase